MEYIWFKYLSSNIQLTRMITKLIKNKKYASYALKNLDHLTINSSYKIEKQIIWSVQKINKGELKNLDMFSKMT